LPVSVGSVNASTQLAVVAAASSKVNSAHKGQLGEAFSRHAKGLFDRRVHRFFFIILLACLLRFQKIKKTNPLYQKYSWKKN
jgi:hypothetical protein